MADQQTPRELSYAQSLGRHAEHLAAEPNRGHREDSLVHLGETKSRSRLRAKQPEVIEEHFGELRYVAYGRPTTERRRFLEQDRMEAEGWEMGSFRTLPDALTFSEGGVLSAPQGAAGHRGHALRLAPDRHEEARSSLIA